MNERAMRRPLDRTRLRQLARGTDPPLSCAPADARTAPHRAEPRVPPADLPARPRSPELTAAPGARPLPVRPTPDRVDATGLPTSPRGVNPLIPFRRRRKTVGSLLPSLLSLGWDAPETELSEDERPGD